MCAVELKKAGLHLSGTQLWLDAHRKTELSFVSHAHADHIAPHEQVIATSTTVKLLAHRLKRMPQVLAADYNEPFDFGGLRIELLPAGHMLGSAQIQITRPDGWRVVYTGDLSLMPSLTATTAQVPECDTLVMESTFGLPRYAFPPKEKVLKQLEAWLSQKLSHRTHPVLLCHPMGKSQEVMTFLASRGFALCAHASIYEVTQLYESCGIRVGQVRRFDGTLLPEEVALFPPRLARCHSLARLESKATAVLTGWAMDPGCFRRCWADAAFPLSDHADFPSLVSFAKATKAREILTHHGFAREFAQALCQLGMDARAVGTVKQLTLFA